MAIQSNILKNFRGFRGIDKRSSSLVRDPQFASDAVNAEFNKSGAIVKRKGFQWKVGNQGGFGLGNFLDVNTTTGIVTEQLLTLDNDLYKIVSDSFTIAYSGADSAYINILLNTTTSELNLTVLEGVTELYNIDVGLGLDEASATTITTVVAAINALTDLTCTYSGSNGALSAAFLDLQNSTAITSGGITIDFKYAEAINQTVSNPFATAQANKNNADFENASIVNLNNVAYIATGYDPLHKYDGQNCYRAGLPQPIAPTTAEDAAGSTFATGEAYYYKCLYKQVDNKGNITLSEISSASSLETIAAATADVDITVPHLSNTSGYNTGCAIVSGAQSSTTTLTVDSGHTFNTGDTAYFYDTVSSAYVTRVITSTTSTTIVWAADTSITVVDNAAISNNLRIVIYRTDDAGASTGLYSIVAEIPNDSITGTPDVYVDQITDANKGAEFVIPIVPRNLPPIGKYMTAFKNRLFIAGINTAVNSVRFSDIDNPEYFPTGFNDFSVGTYAGSKIRGIGSLESAVIVFKDKSVQAVIGDFITDALNPGFRTTDISRSNIGCSSHHTIQPIQGALLFLSSKGVFAVRDLQIQEVSKIIEPEFTRFSVTYNFNKATALNWVAKDKYVLFMPNETADGSSNKYADSTSKLFIYDYVRDAWFEWNSLNMMGGVTTLSDSLYFSARRLDSNSSNQEIAMGVINNYGDIRDFSDHQNAISFSYTTHWEALGEPSILKKFLRLKVFSLPPDIQDGETVLFDLDVEVEYNYNSPAPLSSFTLEFSAGALGWGLGEWGNVGWGDSNLEQLKHKLKSGSWRSIRFTFKNSTALEDTLISGYELEARAPHKPEIKE